MGAKQIVHWFLGGKGLGTQQGTSVWVGSHESRVDMVLNSFGSHVRYEMQLQFVNSKLWLICECGLRSQFNHKILEPVLNFKGKPMS